MNASYRLLLLILCLLLAVVPALHAQDEVADLFARINALRASLGLHPYAMNGALSTAAHQQAQWMADTGDVTHVRPDGSSPRSRALAAGYGSVDVSENIYMGGMANADYAWDFWINSPIHYSGLTNTRYIEIGIGAAHGAQGAAYTLVFGNPGVLPPAPPQANVSSAPAAPPEQPSYVLGLDEHGNIKHEVQPGDTIGDILLIYGYTWDELPAMLELNGLADGRELQPGTVFLVPPHAGTYTPTPGGPAETPTPAATATLAPSTTPAYLPAPGDAPQMIAQLASPAPDNLQPAEAGAPAASATPSEAGINVAAQGSGEIVPTSNVSLTREGTSPWLLVAVGLQLGVLAAAALELVRRARRR